MVNVIKRWRADLVRIYGSRAYVLLLSLTAACAYGFKIAHPAMGIDDTPYAYYFEEGLAAVVGRWVLFVLNKIAHLADFAPFLTDFAAVLILMAAVTVWGTLFYAALGDRIPRAAYWFFSCVFLSCPLIGEVFTYYLHNGIAVGYLCSGLSLCMMWEGLHPPREKKGRMSVGLFGGAALFLVLALGCYESFMIVWLTGLLLVLLAERLTGARRAVVPCLLTAACTAAVSMVLRSIVLKAVIAGFGLEELRGEAVLRSVTELLGWMFEPGAWAEFAMVLKRLFVMYGVFAYAYYPIRMFVLAAAVIGLYALWRSIKLRDVWIVLLAAGSFAAAFLLAVVEGKATLYRSAQFLPLVCGFGMLAAACAVQGLTRTLRRIGSERFGAVSASAVRALSLLAAAVIVWNQCTDLNRWFYVDYQKYEYTKEYMAQVAQELERHYDLSKPVVFTGEWENPRSLVEDAYVPYGSETFYRMKRITDLVDEHLLEKFYRGYGVWVAQTPSLSVVSWGKYAFDTDEELVRFMTFHGHAVRPLTDSSYYEEAERYALDLPHFPKEGSVVDRGDYLIVHF
ncbi:MAG: glucosyltransferase domain-containing protein [Muribaculum sp.]|nr:glucosyltransferase domain-containing protein [Muribaculum sp.]